MTPPATTTAWAIKAPDWHICKGILNNTIRRTRQEAIFSWSFAEYPWKKFYRQGFRCIRVRIEEVAE